MSSRELAALRDDGPLARAAARRSPGRAEAGPFAWLVPPLVRAVEYGGLIAITAATDRAALPSCIALLAALAFHHYDAVYRAAAGRPAPPRWLGLAGGGWEVRLLVAAILAALGVLEVGLLVGAAVLGGLYVSESAASWIRAGRAGRQGRGEGAAEVLE